jgi:hypothetical protein
VRAYPIELTTPHFRARGTPMEIAGIAANPTGPCFAGTSGRRNGIGFSEIRRDRSG